MRDMLAYFQAIRESEPSSIRSQRDFDDWFGNTMKARKNQAIAGIQITCELNLVASQTSLMLQNSRLPIVSSDAHRQQRIDGYRLLLDLYGSHEALRRAYKESKKDFFRWCYAGIPVTQVRMVSEKTGLDRCDLRGDIWIKDYSDQLSYQNAIALFAKGGTRFWRLK